jgi:glutathione S-transferase
MKLYHFPHSPNTRKVLAVIHHLGLNTELETVNLLSGDQMKPEYLALNPNHMTPALQDGDFVLWESNAIMQYLASAKHGNRLWPLEPKAQADISRWQCWQLAHWGPACDTLIYERLVKHLLQLGDPDPAEIAKAEEKFHRFADVLNQHLRERRWIVGDDVTLADLSVGAPLTYGDAAQLPLGDYREIRRWCAGLEEVNAWKKSAPPPMP